MIADGSAMSRTAWCGLTMTDRNRIPNDRIRSELVRDDAALADIVMKFVAGLSDRISRMQDAIRAADYEALRTAAHQLKGSGGGFGYPILTECAAQLEKHAKCESLGLCVEAIEELKTICQRVVVEPAD